MPESNYTRHPYYRHLLISDQERWKKVRGYEGLYKVSSFGRLKSLRRKCRIIDYHGRENLRIVPEKIMTGSPDSRGYLLATFHKDGVQAIRKIHQIVLESFIGSCPIGCVCRHLDGNPANNRLENICWGTPKQNSIDRIEHGRSQRGVVNAGRCLSYQKAGEIRERRIAGAKITALSNEYGVSVTTITSILAGKTWTGRPKKSRKGISQNGGASNGNAALSESQVMKMREVWEADSYSSYSELGRQYGVSASVVARVIKRLSYNNLSCRRVPGTGS